MFKYYITRSCQRCDKSSNNVGYLITVQELQNHVVDVFTVPVIIPKIFYSDTDWMLQKKCFITYNNTPFLKTNMVILYGVDCQFEYYQ